MTAIATPVRVLVADDHGPTRADVCRALCGDEQFEVCAAVGDAAAAVEAAVRERPGICLLDIRMPGGGLSAAWEIGARVPQARIVMLTVSEAETDLFAALRAGAAGYLLKTMDLNRLPAALAGSARVRPPCRGRWSPACSPSSTAGSRAGAG